MRCIFVGDTINGQNTVGRIAYLIKPDNAIDILGVFHGSLDIDRFLKEG